VRSLSRAPGLAAATYNLSVVGDEHGNRHKGTATFTVTGPPVAPPPTTNQPPRGIVGEAPVPRRDATTGSGGIRSVTGAAAADARGAIAGAGMVTGAATGATGATTADTTSGPPAMDPRVADGTLHPSHTLTPIATASDRAPNHRRPPFVIAS
jgi:hypothetical protein